MKPAIKEHFDTNYLYFYNMYQANKETFVLSSLQKSFELLIDAHKEHESWKIIGITPNALNQWVKLGLPKHLAKSKIYRAHIKSRAERFKEMMTCDKLMENAYAKYMDDDTCILVAEGENKKDLSSIIGSVIWLDSNIDGKSGSKQYSHSFTNAQYDWAMKLVASI
jgi:hypothetical protein